MFKPKTFPGQQEGEEILLFLRRYWLSFLPTLLVSLVMIILPFILLLFANSLPFSLAELQGLVILAASSYLLFVLAYLLNSFIDYYFDITIITNRRVVDFEQKGLFSREVFQQPFNTVQDASAKKKGILQTFFNYGDVYIQTAAEMPNFNLLFLPNPSRVAQKIMELHFQYVGGGSQLGKPVQLPTMPKEIEQLPSFKPPPSAPSKPSAPSELEEKAISEEKLKEGGEIELPK